MLAGPALAGPAERAGAGYPLKMGGWGEFNISFVIIFNNLSTFLTGLCERDGVVQSFRFNGTTWGFSFFLAHFFLF